MPSPLPLKNPETNPARVPADAVGQSGRGSGTARPAWVARWGKRAGIIAFMFFFIKGLAWLVVPVALATWWAQ